MKLFYLFLEGKCHNKCKNNWSGAQSWHLSPFITRFNQPFCCASPANHHSYHQGGTSRQQGHFTFHFTACSVNYFILSKKLCLTWPEDTPYSRQLSLSNVKNFRSYHLSLINGRHTSSSNFFNILGLLYFSGFWWNETIPSRWLMLA